MATYPPRLLDPADPESVRRWADAISDILGGQISIGEPVSGDVAAMPNGVKGHMLGSFVQVTTTFPRQLAALVHNLNIPPRGRTPPFGVWNDPLNVAWVLVRLQHDGVGGAIPPAPGPYPTASVVFSGIFTDNLIGLWLTLDNCTVSALHPVIWTFWFFPTTR